MEKAITEGNNREPKKTVMSRQSFTLWEKKLIYHVINRIDSKIGLEWDIFRNMEIKIPTKGNVSKEEFNGIKRAVKSLGDKKYIYTDNITQEVEVIHPYPRVSYKNGEITVLILGEVVPELAELGGGYANYIVEDALDLRSTYSQRLFEILSLKKNFDNGVWKTNIKELRKLLNCVNKYVRKNQMFYERILEHAKVEINEKTRLSVTLSPYDKETQEVIFTTKDKQSKESLKTVLEQLEDSNLNEKQIRCKNNLEKIGVIRVDLVSSILFDEGLQSKFWKWWSVNQISYNEFKNPAGVLLKHLNLVK